jgi:hypothetical protein
MTEPAEGMVLVPAERLRALEALEAKATTIDKYYTSNRSRVLNHYHSNKEAVNEKRRAKYKAKKEAEAVAKAAQADQP